MIDTHTFVARLRSAGVEPGDSNDLRIRKSIMVFAMGLMTAMPMFGLALYWLLGLQLSSTLPLAYQVVSVVTLVAYIMTGGYRFFQYAQLGLFLFFPFVAQLSIGNFISGSSGVNRASDLIIKAIEELADNFDALGKAATAVSAVLLVAFGPAVIGRVVAGVAALNAVMLRNPLLAFGAAIAGLCALLFEFRDGVPVYRFDEAMVRLIDIVESLTRAGTLTIRQKPQ